MKKILLFCIICYLGTILLFGCINPNEKANKLFIEATQSLKLAQETEKTSYSAAFKHYQDTLIKLEEIISKYPSSQLAVELTQEKTKIDSYELNYFKETILPNIKIKADAEEDPLVCAFFIANKKNDVTGALLSTIADQCIEAGQYDQAVQIAKKIYDDNYGYMYTERVLREIVRKYAEAEQYDQALQIARTIAIPPSMIAALIGVASKYVEAGQKEKAFELLSQALQVAEKIQDNDPEKKEVLLEIIREYAEAGQYDRALQITQQIKYSAYKGEALGRIASEYVEVGQKEKAFELLSQALQVAEKIHSSSFDHKIIEAGDKIMIDVASVYAKAGLYDRAFQVVEKIRLSHQKSNAMIEIASKYVESKQYDQALEVIKKMYTNAFCSSDREEVLAHIALKYAESKQYDRALEIVPKIQKDTLSLEDNRDKTLASLASEFAEARLYDQAFQVAYKIRYSSWKLEALTNIATKYARIEQYDQALQIARQIDALQKKYEVLINVCMCMKYIKTEHTNNNKNILLHKIINEVG